MHISLCCCIIGAVLDIGIACCTIILHILAYIIGRGAAASPSGGPPS